MFVRPLIELRRLRKRDTEKRTFLQHRKGGGGLKKKKKGGRHGSIFIREQKMRSAKKVGEGKVYEMMSFFFNPPFLFREQNLN